MNRTLLTALYINRTSTSLSYLPYSHVVRQAHTLCDITSTYLPKTADFSKVCERHRMFRMKKKQLGEGRSSVDRSNTADGADHDSA